MPHLQHLHATYIWQLYLFFLFGFVEIKFFFFALLCASWIFAFPQSFAAIGADLVAVDSLHFDKNAPPFPALDNAKSEKQLFHLVLDSSECI